MRLQPVRVVGVFFQIGAVGQPVAKQDMHDRTGKGRIGAGLDDQADIGLLHGRILVDIDDDDFRPALLAGADGVGHDVDLRHHRVGAPDHHAIGLRHFARVRPASLPVPIIQPVQARLVQMEPKKPEYFFACRSRSMPSRCTSPIVPA